MIKLANAIIAEKNKLCSAGAWLVLLKFGFGGKTVRLVRNNEDITWDGEDWQAFPFRLDDITETDKGEIPSVNVKVSNVTRVMQPYVEEAEGGVDTRVDLYVVHSEHLDDAEPVVHEIFSVVKTTCDAEWATFQLGGDYPTQRRFPLDRYLKDFCPFVFKGPECGYTGDLTLCSHTLKDCRAHGNSTRFGGFPAIPVGGMYVE